MVTIMAKKKVPALHLKNKSLYFRLRVPLPLVEAMGKNEISAPLGRVSQPQAAIKARELFAHYAALFLTPSEPVRILICCRQAWRCSFSRSKRCFDAREPRTSFSLALKNVARSASYYAVFTMLASLRCTAVQPAQTCARTLLGK